MESDDQPLTDDQDERLDRIAERLKSQDETPERALDAAAGEDPAYLEIGKRWGEIVSKFSESDIKSVQPDYARALIQLYKESSGKQLECSPPP